jgi:hypothetical protein
MMLLPQLVEEDLSQTLTMIKTKTQEEKINVIL